MSPVSTQVDDIRVTGDGTEEVPEDHENQQQVIGIIYPPPEVRNIVDKTASFVFRNGPEFEEKIRQNELNNAKFNFLYNTDPYHAYYRHKVKEFGERKAIEPTVPQQAIPQPKPAVQVALEKLTLKDPPAAYEFINDPPTISAYDLDIVRLTALFCAKNGRNFLDQLMQRETKNMQFDFLRPQHSLYQHFTKLVEQYSKILIPTKSTIEKLKKEVENPKFILEDVEYRVEWAKHEERIKLKEQQEIEKERMIYSQIDWHDFVVVETVDFFTEEAGNFPRPVQIEELGARLLQQERIEKYGQEIVEQQEREKEEKEVVSDDEEEDDDDDEGEQSTQQHGNQLIDMDMEDSSDEEEEEQAVDDAVTSQPSSGMTTSQQMSSAAPPKSRQDIIIRKDYDPKMKQQENPALDDKMIISPLTNKPIPLSQLPKEMRYGLIDPRWKEEQEKRVMEKRDENEAFATGSDIHSALKGFADRRTDIFGYEETAIGKKVGEEEEEPADPVTWDGHSSSMQETQRQANEKTTIEEKLHHIQKSRGLLIDDKLEKIGPKPGQGDSREQQRHDQQRKEPTPVPKPVQANTQQQQSSAPVANIQQQPPVQQLRQATVLTPVVMRPMIRVQQNPNPPVLVVQQSMPVVRQQQSQLIAVQRQPTMVMQHPTMVQTQMVQQIPPQMQQQIIPQQQDPTQPPLAKRARTEADLIPAEAFLKQTIGPVMFRVQCPSLPEKTEWNLQGQILTFSLPLTDEVSVIKAKIHEATGMPAGKQKLQHGGLFIKDSNSLAHYNMRNNAVVVLQVKERGGRRK